MRTGGCEQYCGRMLLVLILVGAVARWTAAAVSVSLPLEGYYRPGKYMPVRIMTAGESAPVFIRAAGAVTTRCDPPAEGDVIVPWLVISESPSVVRWESRIDAAGSIGPSLRALNPQERLVAVIDADPQSARNLFAGNTVISISPDTSHSLLQPAQAWQSLDGLVIGASAAARLTSGQIQILLAGGTTIAVASSEKPDAQWPWTRAGELWVLRPIGSGATFGVEPDAYGPTYDWDRGWPASFRTEVVFLGALFCILGTATLLWRSRYAVWGLVGLCAVAIGLIAWRSARRSPVVEKSVQTSARAWGLVQDDRWSFRSPLRPATFDVSASGRGLVGPVFASGGQLTDLGLQLDCGADGRPQRFRLRLERGQSMAFLTRIVRPAQSTLP